MNEQRLVQNFSGRRALLVSEDARALKTLSTTLVKLGLSVETLDRQAMIAGDVPGGLEMDRDVLFVDGDLDYGSGLPADGLPSVPVIGLVGVEAPSRLKGLMRLGSSAFLSKPVYGGSIYSALFLAVNAQRQKSATRKVLDNHEERRRLRRFVIKAVVQTMAARNLDDEAAFAVLRRESMRARLSLEAYCEHVVQRSTTEEACQSPDLGRRQATSD
ncbi:ANTAR domain protein [Hartmannibacter diazotrophicus]|uniref:ANTAR domain protein n=1 Tax=Hartmannibacter diazotrophicus TaxID=1482074 RepID=A0A2C9D5N2_9HYPH|nr:ANTAR domain-containing protein [Hartmannibacter diazotrophicus]SON55642.1 ANTAR domain protein [Hartmannibacter diazotrophicus]